MPPCAGRGGLDLDTQRGVLRTTLFELEVRLVAGIAQVDLDLYRFEPTVVAYFPAHDAVAGQRDGGQAQDVDVGVAAARQSARQREIGANDALASGLVTHHHKRSAAPNAGDVLEAVDRFRQVGKEARVFFPEFLEREEGPGEAGVKAASGDAQQNT